MAEVFRARRMGAVGFSKVVCIKRMHQYLSDDAEFVGLFLDEGRTGSKLRHRNIVAVDDLGEHGGQFFIAMEYIHGVDLAGLEARLQSVGEPFPVGAAVYVAMEVLAALSAAHRALDPDDGTPLRVVHRDVAPHNILLSYAGEVKLGDFGIARAERRAQVTSGGVVRGRFGYMPLEQLSGHAIDGRADLYALGVVLYEMLAGYRPFHGGGAEATVESIVAMQVVDQKLPITQARAGLSDELCAVIDTLLAKDPNERFSTAEAALTVLERAPERMGAAQQFGALMNRLYPTQSSVATASSPAIARASQPSAVSPLSQPSQPSSPPDASQRSNVLQLVPDKSDPLARPFATDPRATPAVATVTEVEPRATEANKPRWPMLFLALALAVASATAITVSILSRANRETDRAINATPDALPSSAVEDVAPLLATAPDASDPDVSVANPVSNIPVVAGRNVRANRNGTASATPERDASAPIAPSVRAPETTNAAPAANARGVLRVVVTPFGQVSIDNGPLSDEFRNARDFSVSAGRHTVRVTGGVEATESVDVGAEQTRVVRFHGNE